MSFFPYLHKNKSLSRTRRSRKKENQNQITGNMAIAAMHGAKPNLDKMVQIAIAADTSRRLCGAHRLPRQTSARRCASGFAIPCQQSRIPKHKCFSNPKQAKFGCCTLRCSSHRRSDSSVVDAPHFGNFWGLASKSIWIFIGLTPAIMAVSGSRCLSMA